MYTSTQTPTNIHRTHDALGSVSQMLELALSVGQQELTALRCSMWRQPKPAVRNARRWSSLPLNIRGLTTSPCCAPDFRRFRELQGALSEEGRQLRTKLMGQINRPKAEGRRMQGYRRAVNHALV